MVIGFELAGSSGDVFAYRVRFAHAIILPTS
jgi:hypothetical protein